PGGHRPLADDRGSPGPPAPPALPPRRAVDRRRSDAVPGRGALRAGGAVPASRAAVARLRHHGGPGGHPERVAHLSPRLPPRPATPAGPHENISWGPAFVAA